MYTACFEEGLEARLDDFARSMHYQNFALAMSLDNQHLDISLKSGDS